MHTKGHGFTLIECLIATVILGAILCIALPAYGKAMSATRLANLQATLLEHLTTSIRHAVISGKTVVLCTSGDGEPCTQGQDWSQGWMAFTDSNGDRERGPNEPILLKHDRLTPPLRMTGSTGRSRITFNAKGAAPGSNTTFTLCDADGRARARSVMLANNGRLRKSAATPAAELACRRP